MEHIAIIFSMMSSNLFFILSSVVGYTYQGIESSNIYVIYTGIIAALPISLFVGRMLFGNLKKLRPLDLFFLVGFPLLISLQYAISTLDRASSNAAAYTFFLYFLIWTVPAIYAAVYANVFCGIEGSVKWFEVLMLFISLTVVTDSIFPLRAGIGFESMAGATYQTASYLTALAYGLNLYMLLFGGNHRRFEFAKTHFYRILCLFLLPLQVVGVLLTGGRGGVVLIAVYSIYLLRGVVNAENISKIALRVVITIVFASLVMIAFSSLKSVELAQDSFSRAFQFISADKGINWEGSSNRDTIYADALDLIAAAPVLGYGLFGFWNVTGYPHNIVLEILLNGGLTYLIFALFVAVIFIRKLKTMILNDPRNRFVLVFFCFPMVQLMFSGTYLSASEFWFSIAFVLTNRSLPRTVVRSNKRNMWN